MAKELLGADQFFSGNFVFVEEIYQRYLKDKNSVDPSWSAFFESNPDDQNIVTNDSRGPSWAKRQLKIIGYEEPELLKDNKKDKKDLKTSVEAKEEIRSGSKDLSLRLANLISSYRKSGHLLADVDPLSMMPVITVAEISPKFHNINTEDLGKELDLNGFLGFGKAKVSEVIAKLNQIYTNKVGAEFEYINDSAQRQWLTQNFEEVMSNDLNREEKVVILKEIVRTERFEQFVHKRFPGAKRFSVEGGDSAINAIEKVINVASKHGVKKIVIGMAHRGRLNVLTGVMSKPYHKIFAEFQGIPGIPESVTKSGDVKYHMGYANSRNIAGNKIDLSLAFNPSHLEAVNSVVTGRVRAKQDLYQDSARGSAMALLVHGDAAFPGQGIVAESLMMNGIKGYDTGGVMHVIINNQIGFTANPSDSRSTKYSSDPAKVIEAPIFHVNGDDVESVVKIADLITRFRQVFKKDAVLDVVCYRKYGHNEGDEPLYTQPLMYSKIKLHPSLEKIYSEKLISQGIISEADYQAMILEFDQYLSKEFDLASTYMAEKPDWLQGDWSKVVDGDEQTPKTGVVANKLQNLITKLAEIPSEFNANLKIAKQLVERKLAVESKQNIDWGTAETLAFASLLDEGFSVRITGQDSGRGTFSHRHSVLHDSVTDDCYLPLNNIGSTAKYEVHDSFLSEFAVLGFEYGYSLSSPNSLNIWEAQFGDFANGAQVMFDQFISSSEVKWLRKSGLVVLLPHGYEGQGPEHSSARLERFLQLCANNNMRVVNITSPANFFHALRRQIHSKDRKPLIVMSPKSLLRHKLAVSNLSDFDLGTEFRPVIFDDAKLVAAELKKVVICSGKVYYDLLDARLSKKANHVALIRLEQFYPFPEAELQKELQKYKNADFIWCQEEPKNMGGWHFVNERLEEILIAIKAKNPRARYVGRIACASPATGYSKYHSREQSQLIEEAIK